MATKDYSFDVPFYAYRVRLVPTDTDQWMLEDWKFDAQPAPELGTEWITPETTFGLHGFFHEKEFWLPHISSADLTLKVYVDGVATPTAGYAISHGAGVFKKTRVILQPTKGKYTKFSVTSASKGRIFQQDIEVLVKQWGGEQFQIQKPFGGSSYQSGAEI